MTTLGQFGEQTIEVHGKEDSRNSVLGRPGPKKRKLTQQVDCVFPNQPNYEIANIYQESCKLQTLRDSDERTIGQIAPTSEHQGKRSIRQ
jgi:hypothetical protein